MLTKRTCFTLAPTNLDKYLLSLQAIVNNIKKDLAILHWQCTEIPTHCVNYVRTMELFSRRRRRLVSAQVVSCCEYEITKQQRQCMKGYNLFDNWVDTSFHLPIAVVLPVTTINEVIDLQKAHSAWSSKSQFGDPCLDLNPDFVLFHFIRRF